MKGKVVEEDRIEEIKCEKEKASNRSLKGEGTSKSCYSLNRNVSITDIGLRYHAVKK